MARTGFCVGMEDTGTAPSPALTAQGWSTIHPLQAPTPGSSPVPKELPGAGRRFGANFNFNPSPFPFLQHHPLSPFLRAPGFPLAP